MMENYTKATPVMVIRESSKHAVKKSASIATVAYRAAKANPARKFGVLYDKVCRNDVLIAAYKQVKANGGARGIAANLRDYREGD